MTFLRKADEVLAKIMKVFVVALCIGIACVLLVRVLIRFTPIHVSLSWTDEVVEWMMAWMIFTGATIIMRDGQHFKVDLLQEKFKGKLGIDLLNIFISVLGVVFIGALFYYSILLVKGATQFSPILKVSTRLPYSSIPVNCFFMLLYLIRDVINGVKTLKANRRLAKQAA